MKKIIKNIGKILINLNERDEKVFSQKILMVDNGYVPFFQLESAVENVISYYPDCEINILTFKHRRKHIENKFPDVNIIIPPKLWFPRYQLAIEMMKIFRVEFDLIVLLSLDFSPVVVALLFMKKRFVALYNRYFQWWRLRLRKIGEKSEYIPQVKGNFSLKNFIIKIGSKFIFLSHEENLLKQNILVVDNGYAKVSQIKECIEKISRKFPGSNILLLPFHNRVRYFRDEYPFLRIILPQKSIIKRYSIAINMLRMREQRFNYVILPSLDLSPLFISLVFMQNENLFLYNKWSQWWKIKRREVRNLIVSIPKFFFKALFTLILFIYLLIRCLYIFLHMGINVIKGKLKKGFSYGD